MGVVIGWFVVVVFGKKMVDLGIFGVKGEDCFIVDEMREIIYLFFYYSVIMVCFVVFVVFVIFVYVWILIFICKGILLKWIRINDLVLIYFMNVYFIVEENISGFCFS